MRIEKCRQRIANMARRGVLGLACCGALIVGSVAHGQQAHEMAAQSVSEILGSATPPLQNVLTQAAAMVTDAVAE
jgi:hypothetical protein